MAPEGSGDNVLRRLHVGVGHYDACVAVTGIEPNRCRHRNRCSSPVACRPRDRIREDAAVTYSTSEPALILRGHGRRATQQRLAVHGVLVAAADHLTAEQVAAKLDDVNLATVYRALSVLQEVGLARSVRLGDGGSSWELAHSDDHAHLVCIQCGIVDHHVGRAVAQLREHLTQDHGFMATDVELVVSGTCATCRGLDAVVPLTEAT